MNRIKIYNPVSLYYKDYNFNASLPIIIFNNYSDLLKQAQNVKQSCILVNTVKNIVNNKISINLTYPDILEVILILNIEIVGKGILEVMGSNYSLSNIVFKGGDKSYKFTDHLIDVSGEKIRIINFEMDNVVCNNDDLDFFRVSNKLFELYNAKFDGKKCNGIFLRLDFPFKHYIKNCVFQNFVIPNVSNGGECIRLATGRFAKDDAYCTIDGCYFVNCQGDPEVVSVKCASNNIKNCVFGDNGGKRLTLRSTFRDKVSNCYFEKNGVRCYGTDHIFKDIQLVDGANILLDNKEGSYVVASNCQLNNIYYENTSEPITDRGKNNVKNNIIKELRYKKESFFNIQSNSFTGTIETGFVFIVEDKNKKIDESNIIILPNDKFTVKYNTNSSISCRFQVINDKNVVMIDNVENNDPYYLFGNINGFPKYLNINVVGVYILKIFGTTQQIKFRVEKSLSSETPKLRGNL